MENQARKRMREMENVIIRAVYLLRAAFALQGQGEDETLVFDEALQVLETSMETLEL